MSTAGGTARLGVLGGSGLYRMDGLADTVELTLDTPFGAPSGPVVVGTLEGERVAFLARHGEGHRVMPSEINFRANIYALKTLGVEFILSASAVGSLAERIHPTDIVLPDQFIDRTRHRPDSFFGDGVVAHVSLADPVCPVLRALAGQAARGSGATVHDGGTYICIEGPQFSTRAESNLYRAWGASIIGMTNAQEARLCREAEICFATMALVTDYDCWKLDEPHVTVETIVARLSLNADRAKQAVRTVARTLPRERACACARALEGAVITAPAAIPAAARARLRPLLERSQR